MLIYHILGLIPELTARLSQENQIIDTSATILRTEKLQYQKSKRKYASS